MHYWQYRFIPLPSGNIIDLEMTLNKMGVMGWELCTSEYGHLIFKRQILLKEENDN
jgi:hypothetical protein